MLYEHPRRATTSMEDFIPPPASDLVVNPDHFIIDQRLSLIARVPKQFG